MSLQTEGRYLKKKSPSPYTIWRFNWPCDTISSQKKLRIEVKAAAIIRWSADNWQTQNDTETKDTGLGIYVADIDFKKENSTEIKFTFFWKEANRWEEKVFEVKVKN